MRCRAEFILIVLFLVMNLTCEQGIGRCVCPPPLQDDPLLNSTNQSITLDKLKARLTEIEGNKEIDESVKNQVLDLYRQAISRLEAAEQYKANGEKFKASIVDAPADTKKVRQSIEELKSKSGDQKITVPEGTSLKDPESTLTRVQADQADLKSRISEYDSQIKLERDRPVAARQQQTEAKSKLSEIEKDLKALQAQPANGEHPLLSEAWRILLEARKQARLAESAMIEQELLSNGVRLDKTMALRDYAAIDNAFRKHDIEISFPQRDVHVRSIEVPLELRGGSDKT